jgi:DNA-binding transcriptional ArsR family regulator
MFSKKEMLMLQHVSRGVNTVAGLSGSMGVSASRVYATASSLKEKGAVRLEDGMVIPERHTYLSLLMTMLHDHMSASDNLSGNGMDLLAELLVEKNVSELSDALGEDRRTVMSRINKMKRNGLVYKDGRKYRINDVFWPELRKLVTEYDVYRKTIDLRVPPDSRVYFRSEDHAVFSNDRSIDFQRTAFSRYGEYGMTVHVNTNYYCTLPAPPTLSEIMVHSMEIISSDKDKRLRTAALIFYKKHIDRFECVRHPVKDEMDAVLRTKDGAAEGWLPLREMQARAEMYGVDLYDI